MKRGDMLPGEIAFKLYDTYGFPFDLTEDALKARGIGVDTKGFAAAMERQRAEARKSWAGSGEAATETLWFELKEELGRHRVPRLRRRGARPARSWRWSRTASASPSSRRASAASSSSTRRRSMANSAARSATAG